MKLIACRIENFGKFHDYECTFTDGLNTVLRENGWGKTTLSVFIKAMFYGLPKSTKRRLDENERKKYTPWQGGVYGGSLTFAVGERVYRIERTFGAVESQDTFELVDAETGLTSFEYDEAVGEKLFGLNAAAYERSTSFAARTVTEDGAETSIQAKLNGLLEDGEDIGAYDAAIRRLDEARKRFRADRGGGGEIATLQKQLEECESEILRARTAAEQLVEDQKAVETCREVVRAAERAVSDAEAKRERESEARTRKTLQDQYRSVLSEAVLQEKRVREEEAFFAEGGVPSEEEILQMEQIESELRKLEAERRAIPLDDYAEEARLFEEGCPTDEALERYALDAETVDRLNISLGNHSAAEGIDYPSRLIEIKNLQQQIDALQSLPTEEEAKRLLSEAEERVDEAERACAEELPMPKRSPARFLPLIGLIASGAFFLNLSFWGMVGLSVFLALCIVLTGVSIGVTEKRYHAALDQRREQELNRSAERKERYEDRRKAQDVIAKIGTRKEKLLRFERVKADIAVCEEYERCLQERAPRLQSLSEAFSRYPVRQANSWAVWVEALRAKAQRYQKYLELKSRTDALDQEIEVRRQAQRSYFALYKASPTVIREHCVRYNAVREELARRRGEVSAFEEKHALTPAFLAEEIPDRMTETDEEKRILQRRLDAKKEELRKAEAQEAATREEAEELPDLESEREEILSRKEEVEEKYAVLVRTKDYLERAKTALSTRYLGAMQEAFKEYLDLFSGERLGRFELNADLKIAFRAGGKKQDLDSLSKGCHCVVRLAERLAYVKVLFEGEKPFLLFDDPFAELDGENLSTVKELLQKASSQYQILYFVCHESRVPSMEEA
ncbi:MAG: ATP-binding protein [Christensenellaceae bacterium]